MTVAALPAVATSLPHVDLDVSLDPLTRLLGVRAKLTVPAGASDTQFSLAPDARITQGKQALVFPAAARLQTQVLHYELSLPPLKDMDHRETLGGLVPAASARGSFLPASSLWYPAPKVGAFTYRVKLTLPAGQRGLVPGRLANEIISAASYQAEFVFGAPAQGIDLMAGPYDVAEKFTQTSPRIRLRTYFHPEIKDLARNYLDSTASYIARYSREIGPYPHSEFSVVSSPTPTGFGMPTLTYLGMDVLRLPFIRHTSLGHEVLHNWWGNGVFAGYETGNWSEGLTAFMADYAFKEDESAGAARAMRLGWLRDLSSLPEDETQTLRAFRTRTHGASQIIGYSKASMLFYVIREQIGREKFAEGLRGFWQQHQFKTATWDDLRMSFEKTSGESLAHLFAQYLDRADLPSVRITNAARGTPGTITLKQSSHAFALRLPLMIHSSEGTTTHYVSMTQGEQIFSLPLSKKTDRISLDSEFQVLRRLDAYELPAILRQTMVDPHVQLVIADSEENIRQIAQQLAEKILDNAPVSSPAKNASTLVIGTHERVNQFLAEHGLTRPESLSRKGSAQAWAAKSTAGTAMLFISVADAASLQALLRPLPHYGSQSYLILEGSKVIDNGVWPGTPLSYELN
ncbi:MAG: M1 family peptidase [Betaproteobacteria bacterium]|nr:M1 family peptidase [Betaproteobacteria bacterium]